MFGIIFGENYYEVPRTSIGRATGIHRVATLLRNHGIDVTTIDFFNSWTKEEIHKLLITANGLDFIGFGIGLSNLTADLVQYTIQTAKNINSNVKVIAGGSWVLDASYTGIDLYFKGPIDGASHDIVKYLTTGKYDPFKLTTVTTHDVKRVVNCTEHYLSFDLKNMRTEYQSEDSISANEMLTLEISRGCVFSCKFCAFPLTGKKKNDYIRDKDDIKQELIDNYTKWGTTRYNVTDDTFNDNEYKIDMLYEISQELDFEVNFMCYARADLLCSKPDTLVKMVKTGFKGMFFGIESLNEYTSKTIGKHLTGDKLKDFLLMLKQDYPQVHITGSFIVGLPHDPFEQVEKNIQWSLDNGVFDSYSIYPMNIPVDNKINYISPFSRSWKDYGYEITSEQEIADMVEKYPNVLKVTGDLSTYTHHFIPWKNNNMNFLESIVLANKIKGMVHDKSSGSGWFKFAQSFDEPNLENYLFTNKHTIDWNKKIENAHSLVEAYKKRKLKNVQLSN